MRLINKNELGVVVSFLTQRHNHNSGPCGFGEEDFSFVFPIVSLWELYVAMETRVLIRSASKPNACCPHPNNDSFSILIAVLRDIHV